MTREEAIEVLQQDIPCEHDTDLIEALDMGIKALENQKSIIEELENLKEEIQGLIDFEESCCGNATLGYECLGVINERIEAIRGKNIEKERKDEIDRR